MVAKPEDSQFLNYTLSIRKNITKTQLKNFPIFSSKNHYSSLSHEAQKSFQDLYLMSTQTVTATFEITGGSCCSLPAGVRVISSFLLSAKEEAALQVLWKTVDGHRLSHSHSDYRLIQEAISESIFKALGMSSTWKPFHSWKFASIHRTQRNLFVCTCKGKVFQLTSKVNQQPQETNIYMACKTFMLWNPGPYKPKRTNMKEVL